MEGLGEPLVIISNRGGMNDTVSIMELAQDECQSAINVEFFLSPVGERRQGTIPLSIQGSSLNTRTQIVHLSEWLPTNDQTLPEWWAVSATPFVGVSLNRQQFGFPWNPVIPDDAFAVDAPAIYQIRQQALGSGVRNLNFFAYKGAAILPTVNRTHCWDGSFFRRASMAAPAAAPGTADTGGGGTYTGVRHFRVRFIELDGLTGVVVRRSEPGPVVDFTPSGAGSGAVLSKPAGINEHETHWELEASLDGNFYYRIARSTVATASVVDSVLASVGYASTGTLSEDIGEYTVLPAAKFLGVDDDRLLLGGDWYDVTKASNVYWTPRNADPGVGNAERLPASVNNSVALDNGVGGPLTGISSAISGTWYAFKWQRIYGLVRTNDLQHAYEVIVISTTQGAIPGSIFMGNDESGHAVVYFLDPNTGPCRIGPSGLQTITGQRNTWKRANLSASNPACGAYYPYKHQAKWWFAADGSDQPSLGFNLQTTATRPTDVPGVLRGGWSQITGRGAQAICAASFTGINVAGAQNPLSQRPVIGQTGPDYIQAVDVGSTDAGQSYVATLVTRPFITSLQDFMGVSSVAVLGSSNATADLNVSLIRDLGVETILKTIADFAPVGAENFVIRRIDDLSISASTLIQVQFSD